MEGISRSEAKSIEQDLTQTYVASAKLIAAILLKLRKRPELKVELEGALPPKFEIQVGRQIAYRGTEGQTPEIDKLTFEQLKYLAEAIKLPRTPIEPTPNKGMNRAVTIKVNDEVVYRLRNGVVEINKLQPEITQEIADAPAPLEQSSPKKLEVAQAEQKSKEQSQAKPEQVAKQPTTAFSLPQIQFEQSDRTQLINAGVDPQQVESAASFAVAWKRDKMDSLQYRSFTMPTDNPKQGCPFYPRFFPPMQQAQQQSKPESEHLKVTPVLVILERRIEQSVPNSSVKQWLMAAVAALKEAPLKAKLSLQQAPNLVANQVTSMPEKLRDRAIAATALQLLDKYGLPTDTGKVYKADGYTIKAKGKDVYSINNHQNREIMRFSSSVLGPRVLESNMTLKEQRDFQHARSQIEIKGLDGSQNPQNIHLQLGNLAPAGTRDMKQELENLSVARTAKRLLHYFGKDAANRAKVFEGKNTYRIEQNEADLIVSAKDGRGVILQLQDGQLKANLSSLDISNFRAIDKELAQDLATKQQRQPQQIKREMELGD